MPDRKTRSSCIREAEGISRIPFTITSIHPFSLAIEKGVPSSAVQETR